MRDSSGAHAERGQRAQRALVHAGGQREELARGLVGARHQGGKGERREESGDQTEDWLDDLEQQIKQLQANQKQTTNTTSRTKATNVSIRTVTPRTTTISQPVISYPTYSSCRSCGIFGCR